jgi:hypothetical protein
MRKELHLVSMSTLLNTLSPVSELNFMSISHWVRFIFLINWCSWFWDSKLMSSISNSWGGFMWHDIYTKFHEDWFRYSSNSKFLPEQFLRLWHWYYLWEGFVMNAVETGWGAIIRIPCFMKNGSGIQRW